MKSQTLQLRLDIADNQHTAVDLLAQASGLPKGRIKDAMTKGAVWLKAPGKPEQRLRRATSKPHKGSVLSLYYDPALLEREPPQPQCLYHNRHYSLWYKPAGLLAQGSQWGDHCSLLRQAELQRQQPLWLIHRLDREAQGLMLLAHDKLAAKHLSTLFQQQQLSKGYLAWVKGLLQTPHWLQLDAKLDGKPSLTEVFTLQQDQQHSWLAVRLHSGRQHQIRRHLAGIGHPLMGDPRYGQDNAWPGGLQLFSAHLAFTCPLSGKQHDFRLFDLHPASRNALPADLLQAWQDSLPLTV